MYDWKTIPKMKKKHKQKAQFACRTINWFLWESEVVIICYSHCAHIKSRFNMLVVSTSQFVAASKHEHWKRFHVAFVIWINSANFQFIDHQKFQYSSKWILCATSFTPLCSRMFSLIARILHANRGECFVTLCRNEFVFSFCQKSLMRIAVVN